MAAIDELLGRIAYFKDKQSESSGLSRFRNNDVLFGRITPCVENGKVAISSGLGNETGIGSTEFVVISPGPEISPRWLYFFLKTYEVRKQATRSMIGTTGRQRVPNEFFERLDVPILQGYITAKEGLTKTIKLSEEAIANIITDVFKIERKAAPVVASSLDQFKGPTVNTDSEGTTS